MNIELHVYYYIMFFYFQSIALLWATNTGSIAEFKNCIAIFTP